MSVYRIKVPFARISALLEVFLSPSDSGNLHLSNEDFAGYAAQTLSDLDINRIDAHLASCSECYAGMEPLLEAAEGWRDLDAKRQIDELLLKVERPSHYPGSLAAQLLLSSAVTGALKSNIGAAFRGLLRKWESWLTRLGPDALSVRIWKPVSLGGFLGPPLADETKYSSTSGQLMPTSASGVHLVLRSPNELLSFEIAPGSPTTVDITINGEISSNALVILLKQNESEVKLTEALRDSELQVRTARFEHVEPGLYFAAMSPEISTGG